MKAINKSGENVLNVSQYPSVEELMAVSDLLISDYSSIFFDFALTGRPSIVYVPDLERYQNEERGFYGNWPHDSSRPIAETTQELQKIVTFVLGAAPQADSETDSAGLRSKVEDNLETVTQWIESRLDQ